MAAFRTRLFIVIWGTVEILFFCGLIFGWASLVYVFKKDGYFSHLCHGIDIDKAAFRYETDGQVSPVSVNASNVGEIAPDDLTPAPTSAFTQENVMASTREPMTIAVTVFLTMENRSPGMWRSNETLQTEGCHRMDEQFNLVYTLAVVVNGVTTFLTGYMMDRLGTRPCRCIGIVCYMTATLLIAYSTPQTSMLLFPGMILLVFGGYFFLLTNLQLGNLFVGMKSTIISLYCGAYDSSAFVLVLVKIAYDSGITVQTSFLSLTALFSICIVSTFWFMPSRRIPFPPPDRPVSLACCEGGGEAKDLTVVVNEHITSREPLQKDKVVVKESNSFRSAALSRLFLLDMLWLTLHRFQSWSFVGRLNPTLVQLTNGDMQLVSRYTSVYASMQFFGIFLAPLSGRLMDRKRKTNAPPHIQKIEKLEVCIASFLIDTTLGLLLAVSVSVPILEVQYASFALHVVHRAMLYGPHSAFIAQAYGSEHFGKLFGLAMSVSASFSLLQYPLFVLVQGPLNGNPFLFNMFVLVLMLVSYIHPLHMWHHCRQQRRVASHTAITTDDKDTKL